MRDQFSVAFDAYCEVLRRVDTLVNAALERDAVDWQLKNACPACSYKLENEPSLKFRMMVAMDGNNSLKRIERAIRTRNDNGELVTSNSIEREDGRSLPRGGLYLDAEEVDRYKDEVKNFQSKRKKTTSTTPTERIDAGMEPSPCVDRWTNLANDSEKKTWGIFDEAGVFIATCRHGIVLLVCDMIRSGEL